MGICPLHVGEGPGVLRALVDQSDFHREILFCFTATEGMGDEIVLRGGIRLTEGLSEGLMEQHKHYQSLQDQAYNELRSKII